MPQTDENFTIASTNLKFDVLRSGGIKIFYLKFNLKILPSP